MISFEYINTSRQSCRRINLHARFDFEIPNNFHRNDSREESQHIPHQNKIFRSTNSSESSLILPVSPRQREKYTIPFRSACASENRNARRGERKKEKKERKKERKRKKRERNRAASNNITSRRYAISVTMDRVINATDLSKIVTRVMTPFWPPIASSVQRNHWSQPC